VTRSARSIERPEAANGGRPLRSATTAGTIPALAEVLDELTATRVPFCAWKSNLHLEAALSGATDLDLLVDRSAAARFEQVVARHRLVPLTPAAGASYPAMAHYLGVDRPSGRLFHLHVHFQLVLGERHVKNHRLALERQFLSDTRVLHGVRVPRAELDLTVLCIRAMLKYRARDVVKDVLRVRSPGIPEEIQREIAWLRADADAGSFDRLVSGTLLPAGAGEVVRGFLDVVDREPRNGIELTRLRARLRRSLRSQRRRGRATAVAGYAKAVLHQRWRANGRGTARMTPRSGGLAVAVVGADGSGKSTVTAELARWLGWKLDARALYMGSKEPSTSTRWSYLVFRALRRAQRAARAPAAARATAALRDTALAVHHLSTGQDRARRHAHAMQAVNCGVIVLFDRFPAECISDNPEHALLDGPQIEAVLGDRLGPVTRVLAAWERRLYHRGARPDLLVVLVADVDVAAARKPDHDPVTIARKRRAALELAEAASARGMRVLTIDANRPLDDVLLAAKGGLWDAL
jgi:thymidylate kinase